MFGFDIVAAIGALAPLVLALLQRYWISSDRSDVLERNQKIDEAFTTTDHKPIANLLHHVRQRLRH